jgi:uncharacterized protein (TIGR03083 family)
MDEQGEREMAKPDVWPAVHVERQALATDLDDISDESWTIPSLCGEWTVRDVLAHMTATGKISGPQFFVKLAASGLSLKKLQTKDISVERGTSPSDTLTRFKENINSTSGPPGPAETMLGETIVHSEDIRRPLGLTHTYSSEAVVRVADFYKGSNLIIGTKKRIAGLNLQATDLDWQHGSGPTVSGPLLALLLAMTGRKAALDDLSGDGIATLRGRT